MQQEKNYDVVTGTRYAHGGGVCSFPIILPFTFDIRLLAGI
jgi:hypothetical protein